MWKNSDELLETIHDAHNRLKSKETDAMTAHAEARLLGAATRVLAITLEHARLTNRLHDGSSLLPSLTLDSQPAIDVSAEPRQIAQNEAKAS